MIYSESGDYIWRIQNKLLTLLYKQEAIVTAQAVLHIYSSIGCTGQIGILINFSESPRQVVYLMACRYCAFNAAWGRITEGREHSNLFSLGVSSSSPVQPSFYPFSLWLEAP